MLKSIDVIIAGASGFAFGQASANSCLYSFHSPRRVRGIGGSIAMITSTLDLYSLNRKTLMLLVMPCHQGSKL